MSDADAKKKKVFVPAPLKLKAPPKASELLDLVGDYAPPEKKDQADHRSKLGKPTSVPGLASK